jgi:hypothetical protein
MDALIAAPNGFTPLERKLLMDSIISTQIDPRLTAPAARGLCRPVVATTA